MKLFTYTNNDKKEVVFVCEAETITEADQQYQAILGVHPIKQPYVGCQIELKPA